MIIINWVIIYGIAGAINLIFMSQMVEEFIDDQNTHNYSKLRLFSMLSLFYFFCVLLWPYLLIAHIQDIYDK